MTVALDRLRSVVLDSLGKHLYENAIFFADKLVTLSGGESDDVYRLAQAYMFTKQYRRALHVLRQYGKTTASSRFRYLTAKCLAECQELDECLTTLEDTVLQTVEQVWAHTAATGSASSPSCVSMPQPHVAACARDPLRRRRRHPRLVAMGKSACSQPCSSSGGRCTSCRRTGHSQPSATHLRFMQTRCAMRRSTGSSPTT